MQTYSSEHFVKMKCMVACLVIECTRERPMLLMPNAVITGSIPDCMSPLSYQLKANNAPTKK